MASPSVFNTLPVVRVIQTNNHDVAGLVRRLDRALVEVTKSQSTNISGTLPFDITRLQAIIASARSYRAWMSAEPFLDSPATTPLFIEVPCFGVVVAMDNDSAWDVAQLLDTAILELQSADSGRISNGFPVAKDGERFDAFIMRIEKLLQNFMMKVEPMDYPESSPRASSTGQGNTGLSYTGKTAV
jgi:hypothetical protein